MTELQIKSLRTLEFYKITQLLADEAVSETAKEHALALVPTYNKVECERLLEQTKDAVYLMGLYGSPYFGGITRVTEAVSRANKGGMLSHRELLQVSALLATARGCKTYIANSKNQKTKLEELFEGISGNKFLEDKINAAILTDEDMADTASSELYDIRRSIKNASSKVRDVLNKIISSQAYSKMLQDNIVTIRSDRYVVPIKSEYRSSFPGLVHDMSSTGATLFIEPMSVVEINNQIKTLMSSEKKEMERILYELSADVSNFGTGIDEDYNILCMLDFIFAKSKLAYNMMASCPAICQDGETRLVKARHPLLERKTAVPITIKIGGENDTVVVTGPNTGGKTVSIKTMGLLTIMAQCGLFIPADEESRVAIRKSVYADIGDEQSIEQSLSTFSSHMRNIVEILQVADSDSLVLLDELGAGTDPVEGAALATAIIEHLRSIGARIIATTHYAELKIFALETVGVENASCEFDVATLKPTYRLIFGIPGKSNAFAISQRLGLSTQIVDQAKVKINTQNKKFEEVISKLEEKRQALESNIEQAEQANAQAQEQKRQAEERLTGVDRERERLLEGARKEASHILHTAKRASDEVFDQLKRVRKAASGGENVSEIRANMRGTLNRAEEGIMPENQVRKAVEPPRPITKGDTVRMVQTGIRAVVLEVLRDGKVLLQAGIMRVTSRLDEVELCYETPVAKVQSTVSVTKTAPSGKVELDLRGKMVDEALMELDTFIDMAIRGRLPYVTIIHGKGTGALRTAVHSHLKNTKHIKDYRLGAYGEGDAGVTVVTF